MLYTVERAGLPPLTVEADDHRVEGAHHVFRRDTTVLSRPRSVVALRLPLAGVVRVETQVEVRGAGEAATVLAPDGTAQDPARTSQRAVGDGADQRSDDVC